MGGEFRLPEAILQVIQSFLSGRDAARTTLLSKSWGSAWLTLPNLDFDLTAIERPYAYGFRRTQSISSQYVEKTLQRYEDSNLKIESFWLCSEMHTHRKSNPNPWIVKALQLGATRLTLQLSRDDPDCVLDEMLGVESQLEALYMESCNVITNREDFTIACSMLQSLSLNDMVLHSVDTIFHIISSCPLLRKLSLCRFKVVFLDPNGLTNTIRGHGLRSLVLEYVTLDILFLHDGGDDDLSSIFPSLREITIKRYEASLHGLNSDLIISSRSLEHVDVNIGKTAARIKLDVPSIRKFTFRGSFVPMLSISSNSRSGSWESHVSISRNKGLSTSFFRKLNKLLTEFSSSRIYLSIRVISKTSFEYEAGDIQGLPTPEIENLNIYHVHMPSISCLVLFDGLFRICRPKFITQYESYDRDWSNGISSRGRKKTRYNIGFLGKKLLEASDLKISTPNIFMYGLNDLKEARAEVFDELVSAWRDVPLDALLLLLPNDNDSTHRSGEEDKPKVRFQLDWQTGTNPLEEDENEN